MVPRAEENRVAEALQHFRIRLHHDAPDDDLERDDEQDKPVRPEPVRRTTHPDVAPPPRAYIHNDLTLVRPPHSRNRSPLSRSHLGARSGSGFGSSSSASLTPPMVRARSLPSVHTAGHVLISLTAPSVGPPSPLRSPSRARSPFLPPVDEALPMPTLLLYDGAFESINEDTELDIAPRPLPERSPSPLYSTLNSARTLASRRQRPTSPLHGLALLSCTTMTSTPLSSSASSPSLASSARSFSEQYPPALHHYASTSSFSSMPSTPTSARSRSPSISSLETIEDAPDAESEAMALEAERLIKMQLHAQAAADAAGDNSDGETQPRRRSSLDIPGGSRTGAGFGFRTAAGVAGASRKRWSICGGERRADLDLETIWED